MHSATLEGDGRRRQPARHRQEVLTGTGN